MNAIFTFVSANVSQKNGKTYITILNPKNYSKLTMEAVGNATVNGITQGDKVNVLLDLSGDGFKARLAIEDIKKVS